LLDEEQEERLNKAFDSLKGKVAGVVRQGDLLVRDLEHFGWKDDRPARVEAKTSTTRSYDIDLFSARPNRGFGNA